MTQIKFAALVGEHIFTGADFGVVPVRDRSIWDPEVANCFRFVLDGVTYVAVEDESDGYRSSMRDLYVSSDTDVPSVPPVRVVLTHQTAGEYGRTDDVLVATVIATGRELFTIGTRNTDDYYPWFEAHYDITALPGNEEVAS